MFSLKKIRSPELKFHGVTATRPRARLLTLASIIISASLLSCAREYSPAQPEDVPFMERAQTEERNGLRVTGAVLSDDESRRIFGVDLYAIDPDLDEARSNLEQNLVMSGSVTRFGYIKGVPTSTPDEPERNFMNQPWYSDGLRTVFYFGDDHGAIADLRFFLWDWPGEQGEQVIEYLKEVRRKREAAVGAPESY